MDPRTSLDRVVARRKIPTGNRTPVVQPAVTPIEGSETKHNTDILKYRRCVRKRRPWNAIKNRQLTNQKMAVFSAVAPYRLVEVFQHFRWSICLHNRSEDGGTKHL